MHSQAFDMLSPLIQRGEIRDVLVLFLIILIFALG